MLNYEILMKKNPTMKTVLVEIVNLEILVKSCVQGDEFCIQMQLSLIVYSCQAVSFIVYMLPVPWQR